MTIILFGDLTDNQRRNEIELLTRELRRACRHLSIEDRLDLCLQCGRFEPRIFAWNW